MGKPVVCFVCKAEWKVSERQHYIIVKRGCVCIKHHGIDAEYTSILSQRVSELYKSAPMDVCDQLMDNLYASRNLSRSDNRS